MQFSIIVSAHNAFHHLKELIPILLHQSLSAQAIIIVDDRSTDETPLLYTEFPEVQWVKISTLENGWDGKKAALTQGIALCTTDWMLFTDADCRPGFQWAEYFFSDIKDDTEMIVGYSPVFKTKGLLNTIIRYETQITGMQYIFLSKHGFPIMVVGRNLAYKKSWFNNISFQKIAHHIGGDDDLLLHLGKPKIQVITYPESVVYTFGEKNWNKWMYQKLRHTAVSKYYPLKAKVILTALGLIRIVFWLAIIFLATFAHPFSVLMLLAVRYSIAEIIHRLWYKQTQDRTSLVWLPITDLFLAIYYLLMAPASRWFKVVSWKK